MPTNSFYGLSAYSVAITDNKKILVAGYSLNTANPDFALALLNPDGSLDSSFGNAGKVTTSFGGGSDIAQNVVIQPDGKILVAGYSDLGRNNGDADFAIARYNANGTLDSTFGVGGKVTTAIGNPLWGGDYAFRIGLASDGSILVSGQCATLTGSNTKSSDFAVAKYLPNGDLDTSFSDDGIATVAIGNASDHGMGQYVYSDGKVLVGGWSESNISGNRHASFSMAKFNIDGSLDSSFGDDGKVSFEPTEVASWYTNNASWHVGTNLVDARDLKVLPNGKILITGNIVEDAQLINGLLFIPRHMALIQFNSDGTLDESFGTAGVSNIPKIGFSESPYSILIQEDGKIVVGGYGWTDADSSATANIDFCISRLNSDGSLDSSFNGNGQMGLDFNGSRDYLFDMKLMGDGVIVAAGFTEVNGKADLAVALVGTNGGDALSGTVRIDKIFGNGGDDVISGGAGADYIDGGDGIDTADFSDKTKSVVVSLDSSGSSTVTVNGIAEDTLLSIENLIGGSGADTLTASSAGSELTGGSGNDILNGGSDSDILYAGNGNDSVSAGGGDDLIIGGDGAGNDIYNGGYGIDTVKYTSALAGIKVDLLAGTAISIGKNDASRIGSDILTSIENVTAGNFSDVIIGNNLSNTLLGMGGGDTFIASAGNDYLDGGAGIDTANYSGITQNIWMWLGGDVESSVSIANDALESDTILNIENFISGSGDDWLIGDLNSNQLTGGLGSDRLDGGEGADTLIGGAGNDIYYVDNIRDVVTEAANAGIDSVQSSVSYTLAANIENLTLSGTGTINGTGNSLNNIITGNNGDNVINGGAGIDVMNGGDGSDLFVIASSAEHPAAEIADTGASGTDEVRFTTTVASTLTLYAGDTGIESVVIGTGNASSADISGTVASNINVSAVTNVLSITGNNGNNILTGTAYADTLIGNAGNDTLNGGAGADTLIGGAGNDIYMVDNSSDTVTESLGAGIDEVRSSVSFLLGDNLENLVLTGSGDLSGSGNSLVNKITGNAGANTLDGGEGADTLIGGAGNDIYYVDNIRDVVTEAANAGIDSVQSSVSYTLGANIENLYLNASTNINGTGNALNNIIEGEGGNNALNGGAGNDTIYGGLGNDTLIGGTGNDFFVFTTTPNATSNLDTITDFNVINDTIQLENAVFTGLGSGTGTLDSSLFRSGAGFTTADDSSDRIIYNTTSGALFYDADGSGVAAAVQIALIGNKAALTADDFIVI